MFLLKQLLPGVLAAAIISGGLLGLAAWLRQARPWIGALAIGLGYGAGHVITAGWPPVHPTEATQWLPFFVLAALVASVGDAWVRPWGWLRGALWMVLCTALLRLLLQSKFQYGWTPGQGVLWLAGLAAGMLLLAWRVERAALRGETAVPLVLTMVAGATGAALMLSGSMLLGLLALVLTSALAAALVITWVFPNTGCARGMVPVAVVILGSLWVSGYFYAELPAVSAALLYAAPSLALTLPLGEGLGPGRTLLLRAGMAAVPLAVALLLALQAPPLDY